MTKTMITSKEFRNKLLSKNEGGNENTEIKVAKEAYSVRTSALDNVLRFVFSSKNVDRSGDRVFPDGLDFRGYLARNPLILMHHDLHSLPIGKTISLGVEGDELIGDVEFFTDLEEANVGTNARACLELIKRGVMGLSITFLPKEVEPNNSEGIDFKKAEILETSVVSVPCNPDAFKVEPVKNGLDAAALLRRKNSRMRKIALARDFE